MREKISKNDKCPCGSGKKYENCCYNKDYTYMKDSNGKIYKVVSLDDPIILEILDKEAKHFKDVFGRDARGDDPLLVDSLLLSEDDYKEQVSQMLEEYGIRPSIIYASRKLGYCIVDGFQNRYTDQQIKDWDLAIKEYYELVNEEKRIVIPKLFQDIESIVSSFDQLKLTYALIIQKYNKIHGDIFFVSGICLEEYSFFLLTKNLKSIKAIELLIENNLGEDSLNLIRSTYENYLQILMAIHAPKRSLKELNAKIGLLNSTYYRDAGFIRERRNPENKIKLSTGVERAALNERTKNEDVVIYKYLYNMLSSYTHPDISSLENYFNKDGFTHLERNFVNESKLYLCLVNILIFSELAQSVFLLEEMKIDLEYYIKNNTSILINIFEELRKVDENIPIEIIARLKKIVVDRK